MILDRNIIKNFEQNKEIEASKEIISASMAKSLTENYWKDKGLDFKGQILDSIFYNINNAIQEGIPYCTFKNDKLNKNYAFATDWLLNIPLLRETLFAILLRVLEQLIFPNHFLPAVYKFLLQFPNTA